MSADDLWASWRLWMAVAAAIVLVAATLLIVIWTTARAIYREALRALAAAERIRQNTQPIWELQTTNEVAEDLLATVQAIEQKGGALAAALAAHEPRRAAGEGGR